MTARRIQNPEFLPVTLAEARLQCRVDPVNTSENDLLSGIIIPGAVEACQQTLLRSIMLQTWRVTLDDFADPIELPWGTVLDVSAVQYRDTAGNWATLPESFYELDLESGVGRVSLADRQTWPSLWRGTNVVRVTYTAGFAAGTEAQQQAAVPASIKQWLLMTVGTAFIHRESLAAGMTVSELPGRFIDGLLDGYRVWRR